MTSKIALVTAGGRSGLMYVRIPAEIESRLGLSPGGVLAVTAENGRLVFTPASFDGIEPGLDLENERKRNRVVAAIKACGGHDGWASNRQILRAARTANAELSEILISLADDGMIETRDHDSNGKARTMVRLVPPKP